MNLALILIPLFFIALIIYVALPLLSEESHSSPTQGKRRDRQGR